jgi:NifU-like protein involved in Fe-S cluster formation
MAETPLEDHFHHPRNAGPLPGADLQVEAENPVCGDLMRLYLRLGPDRRVAQASFQVYGCPAAIAAGSVLTGLLVGCGTEELGSFREETIDRALGGLDGEKAHAATLAADAVRAAHKAIPPPQAPLRERAAGSGGPGARA